MMNFLKIRRIITGLSIVLVLLGLACMMAGCRCTPSETVKEQIESIQPSSPSQPSDQLPEDWNKPPSPPLGPGGVKILLTGIAILLIILGLIFFFITDNKGWIWVSGALLLILVVSYIFLSGKFISNNTTTTVIAVSGQDSTTVQSPITNEEPPTAIEEQKEDDVAPQQPQPESKPDVVQQQPETKPVTQQQSVPQGKYVLIIESLSTQAAAEKFGRKLQAEGISYEIIDAGNQRFRISVASFDNLEEAKQQANLMKSRPYCEGVWVTKR